MIPLKDEPRKRAKQLTRKIAATPVLPLLGITKAVEIVIVGGPTGRWLAYAGFVTIVWVFAEDLQRRAEDATETVQDAVDGEES